jgi:hypothetical protein
LRELVGAGFLVSSGMNSSSPINIFQHMDSVPSMLFDAIFHSSFIPYPNASWTYMARTSVLVSFLPSFLPVAADKDGPCEKYRHHDIKSTRPFNDEQIDFNIE